LSVTRIRTLASTLLLLAAACGGHSTGGGAAAQCNPNGCLSTTIVITGFYQDQTLSPCSDFTSSEYNKGLGKGFSCSATLPACGDGSVDAINSALADPDVVAALQAVNTSFVDPTASGQFEIGAQPPGVILPPSAAGPHEIFVGGACAQSPCTPAPPGVVRLAHLLSAVEMLCVPNEGG
jgi:hypothetical protein